MYNCYLKGEMNGDGGDFTRIMQQQNSNPANGVITDPANSSRNNRSVVFRVREYRWLFWYQKLRFLIRLNFY